MHVIRLQVPSAPLRRYIRCYASRQGHLPAGAVVHPVPARSTTAIEFTFGDPYIVVNRTAATSEPARQIVVVGLQTYRRVELVVAGSVDAFAVFFEPTGLMELFSTRAPELTNRDLDATSVIGSSISELGLRLADFSEFDARVRAADEFFTDRARRFASDEDDIVKAVRFIREAAGCTRVDRLAGDAGRSTRQLQRLFSSCVGVTPKMYARIVRFESALEYKAASPRASWTSIAHQFGYHDQMHMIHDFQKFSASAPTELLRQMESFLPILP